MYPIMNKCFLTTVWIVTFVTSSANQNHRRLYAQTWGLDSNDRLIAAATESAAAGGAIAAAPVSRDEDDSIEVISLGGNSERDRAASVTATFNEVISRAITIVNKTEGAQFNEVMSRGLTILNHYIPPPAYSEVLSLAETVMNYAILPPNWTEVISRAATVCESCQDADSDGDGIFDNVDNCPSHWNSDQTDCDQDTEGDACAIASGHAEDCTRNGIPDECEPDCNNNGHADSCDIAALTAQCPTGTAACADCNLNRVPDGCDIVLGTSRDVNSPFGVPDECVETQVEANWSDDVWGLMAPAPYPDNLNPDAVPDLHVTLPGSAQMLLDVTVQVDSLAMRNGSTLNVIQPGKDLNIKSPGDLSVQGELSVANDRVITVEGGSARILSGGRYAADSSRSAVAAKLIASSVLLDSPDSNPMTGSAPEMVLTDQMHAQSNGDFVIRSNPEDRFYMCEPNSVAAGGITPAIVEASGQATLEIRGSFIIFYAALYEQTSTKPLKLMGDFVNGSVYPACFRALDGTWLLNGTAPQTLEAGGEDRGASLAGFQDNFAIGTLELAENTTVRVVDAIDNQQDGAVGCDEVLYVRNLVLHTGSRLETEDGCQVYFECLQNDGGEIPSLGRRVLNVNRIILSNPLMDSIDARQPADLANGQPAGWDALRITFSGPVSGVSVADFDTSTSCMGQTLPAPQVSGVVSDGNSLIVQLTKPIPAGCWTTVHYLPSCAGIRMGFLPGDVNGDRCASGRDIIALIDSLNGILPRGQWATDVNRSGASNAQDILRLVDLLNGAGAFDAWNGRCLPD